MLRGDACADPATLRHQIQIDRLTLLAHGLEHGVAGKAVERDLGVYDHARVGEGVAGVQGQRRVGGGRLGVPPETGLVRAVPPEMAVPCLPPTARRFGDLLYEMWEGVEGLAQWREQTVYC